MNYEFSKKGLQGRFRKSSVKGNDDRKGLGYGVLEPSGRFEPRKSASHYPYIDPDPYHSLDNEDEETQVAMRKKLSPAVKSDPGAHKSADPFYFAAGNTKLSDCFNRPDIILNEVEVVATSMSSVPSHYKSSKAAAGVPPVGVNNLSRGPYHAGLKRTGSKYGFSHAPKLVTIFDDDIDDLSSDDIDDVRKFNIKDFIDDEMNYNLIKHSHARHQKVDA